MGQGKKIACEEKGFITLLSKLLVTSTLNTKFLYGAVEALHEYMLYVSNPVVLNSLYGNSHADWL